MAKLLFLAHRLPFPPNKGDKIRSWNMLQWLAQHHEVHVGAFIDDPVDEAHAQAVIDIAASSYLPAINPAARKLMALTGMLTLSPLSVSFYRHPGMQRWVDGLIASGAIDAVVAFSGAMARFVRHHMDDVPVIMDFVDVDSDKWDQYARAKSAPISWVYGYEANRLAAFESTIAQKAAHNLLVTPDEAALFAKRVPAARPRISALPNGVNAHFFDPATVSDTTIDGDGPVVTFTGAMDYWANEDAVQWFADEVWPRVCEKHADARFFIVGGKPTHAVQALGLRQGITVTGRVADVRPYLLRADAVVAPMRIARGVQNKVLEGMAMGRPVITTSMGFEGIKASPGEDLVVCDQPEDFARAVCSALGGNLPENMGVNARNRVLNHYSWEANLAPLGDLIDGAIARATNQEGMTSKGEAAGVA